MYIVNSVKNNMAASSNQVNFQRPGLVDWIVLNNNLKCYLHIFDDEKVDVKPLRFLLINSLTAELYRLITRVVKECSYYLSYWKSVQL
jgi:hypothetical protein